LIYTSLLIIAIFQGIVLSVIILKSPLFRSIANKYLAYAIFTLSILILNLVFELTEAFSTIPFLRFIDNIEWAFIFPVFILLFVINQVNHPVRNSKKLLWLFLPFGYSATISTINFLNVYGFPILEMRLFEVLTHIEFFLAISFIPSVLIYTYSFLKFSIDQQEKKWLAILWAIVSILLFSWVLALLLALFLNYGISYFMKILALLATFVIHWTAYIGIYKFKLARDPAGINTLLKNELLNSHNKVSSDFNPEMEVKKESLTVDNHYFKKLEILCTKHQIYRDNSLNREKIAEELGISAGYVSQLINTVTGKNFTNYINQYRIDEVKKMILDSEFENYSLLAIGLESGFTSKTTFYKSFKKVTGMTPNEYRKSLK